MQRTFRFISLVNGQRAGTFFQLTEGRELLIGRGVDCQIVLTDPLSSRVHARLYEDDGGWWLRDENSCNGTFLNGQKIDSARLVEGSRVRIGSVQMVYHESNELPSMSALPNDHNITQTIVREVPLITGNDPVVGLSALRDTQRANDFLNLYQLSIKLLGCSEPDQVVKTSLELLHDRMGSSVTGFMWMNDDGQLRAKLMIPEAKDEATHLSQELTDLVCKQRHAVWVENEGENGLTHFADAICVPLTRDDETLGAVHTYLEKGRYKETDFEFARSIANIVGVGLVSAREKAKLRADHQALKAKNADQDDLIGESKPMQELKAKAKRVARATGCVLIRGESGSGKELVSRAVHRASTRADRPMLTVNCAAIPRDLMESQLFGHKKGAFTGADQDHTGWFEQADSGTLFLDEVGEMTLEGQAKLLRILEGHPFLPVGGTKEVSVDVRIIAATNRDLAEFVREGRFREDLYYRLSVFELYVPPLRDREGDISLLVDHFLEAFKMQHGRPDLTLSKKARERLLKYHWPGNVRQLRNVVDSAVVMAGGEEILADDLGLRDTRPVEPELDSLKLDYWEKKLISEALKRCDGNVPAAAKLLGIGRATLYRKIDEYAIVR